MIFYGSKIRDHGEVNSCYSEDRHEYVHHLLYLHFHSSYFIYQNAQRPDIIMGHRSFRNL